MTDRIQLQDVATRRELGRFIELPWSIYRGDPSWVPPLRSERRQALGARAPFLQNAAMSLFLARIGDRDVGRIAAIENRAHNETHGDRVGFFGFFECIDRPDVACALFERAARWLRERGLTCVRGPLSPSTNYEAGLLVDGFDEPPRFLMSYNPGYYRELVTGAGFRVVKQLLAYRIETATVLASERIARVAAIAARRHRVAVRRLDMTALRREVQLIRSIYNQSWRDNWGFVPMSEAEADAFAANLRPLLDPALVQIAEVDGRPVGIGLVIHDYNEILARLDGRLFPFGIIRLLTGRRTIRWLRLLLLGVVPAWRTRGVDALLYRQLALAADGLGLKLCEGSWVLEDNVRMNDIIPYLGGTAYKRYAIYERPT